MAVDRIHTTVVSAWCEGLLTSREDQIVVEEPLEIRLGGDPLVVVMRTPGHDIELAAGLLFAEEILRSADDIGTIAHCRDAAVANVVNVALTSDRANSEAGIRARAKAERSMISSASCGVCGKKSIEALHIAAPPFARPPSLDLDWLASLPDVMRKTQQVFEQTGGLHAASVFGPDRQMLTFFEDVGRHNAVDKCVGRLLVTEQLPIENAVLVVSGRTSFEIIQKALVARIQTVVAVSAPSSLAVELARASNMALCGFVRGSSLNVYAGI